jgi:hypothetical protein
MKESYECEVGTHIGPESCGAAREGGVEALTGERAGRVFSRVRELLRDADAVKAKAARHPGILPPFWTGSSALSSNYRFVIAFHSLRGVVETGLHFCGSARPAPLIGSLSPSTVTLAEVG